MCNNLDKQEQDALRKEYRQRQARRWNNKEKMVEYCTNKAARLVKLSSGDIFAIDKPNIETRFCFGYSLNTHDTEDYDDANRMTASLQKNERYFKEQNLSKFREEMDILQGKGRFANNVPFFHSKDGIARLDFCRRDEAMREDAIPCTEEDKRAIVDAYQIELKAFDKRLNTYLKRYGMKNIRTWSYWRDE